MPMLSVIIVNYNGRAYLQGAIDSLKSQTFQDFEVIVLDNDSSDGSFDEVDIGGLPDCKLMAETDNHGFAKGNNLAASAATSPWLVLMNPDTVAAADRLEEIVAGLHHQPRKRNRPSKSSAETLHRNWLRYRGRVNVGKPLHCTRHLTARLKQLSQTITCLACSYWPICRNT